MNGSPVGIVLGSGLGAFAHTVEERSETPYSSIPGWPPSTAIGHEGKIVTGRVNGRKVIVLAGRAHLYEGYTAQQVVFGIRELHRRGVRSLILTNASGGVNLTYKPGDLVLLTDHINLMGTNPLVGPNDDSLGPRFPDMSDVYCEECRKVAVEAGREIGLTLKEGIYAGVLGPSYETPAEIRYLRTIGADLVGMSTVPEAIAANHLGMNILGLACVTNMAAGIQAQKVVHEEVLEIGERMRDTLVRLLRLVIPRLP
jgi:purine-nucleoside phosphorylase